MNVYNNPARETWNELTRRPQIELGFLESSVRNILNRVKKSGDQAIRDLTLQYDKVAVAELEVTKEEMKEARQNISQDLQKALRIAADNITKFHNAQKREPLV